MATSPSGPVVGVVGGGAAGTLVLAALRAAGPPAGTGVLVFEPRPEVGPGVAYSTPDPAHLLNVPAGRLGGTEQDPGDFLEWLRRDEPAAGAGEFVERARYGRYLTDLAGRARDTFPVRHVPERVVGLRHHGGRVGLTVATGTTYPVDSVVLAHGDTAVHTAWAPGSVASCGGWVPEPWRDRALDAARDARSVLVVGTGLTMVDVALALDGSGAAVTAVSPSGRPPAAHRPDPLPPVPPPDGLADEPDPATIVRRVDAHVRRCLDGHGDWRPAIDGLRPITSAVWRGLSTDAKRWMLRTQSSRWNRSRHRMPPAVAARVDRLRSDGRLTLRPGRIHDVSRSGPGLTVTLDDGSRLRVDVIVNATGPDRDVRRARDPLLSGLLADGTARPGPLGLGLATADGQLLSRSGRPVPGVYTLGSTRVGELWETTAIPEIRRQAANLAARVVPAAGG